MPKNPQAKDFEKRYIKYRRYYAGKDISGSTKEDLLGPTGVDIEDILDTETDENTLKNIEAIFDNIKIPRPSYLTS